MAMMVGAMLKAAEQRHLILVDGLPACAALLIATHIAGPVIDYCLFCRSTDHHGLDTVLAGFESTALLALGLESLDGTGIALSWPLVRAAAALLTDVADPVEPLPPSSEPEQTTQPDDMVREFIRMP
jgi:nicotinate-nucleotide--dimethylbenzimidazole phosphoribosyltransferase